MSYTFFGEWPAEMTVFDSAFSQRFVITDAYDGIPGVAVQVNSVHLDFNDLVVTFRSLDPEVDPPDPVAGPRCE